MLQVTYTKDSLHWNVHDFTLVYEAFDELQPCVHHVGNAWKLLTGHQPPALLHHSVHEHPLDPRLTYNYPLTCVLTQRQVSQQKESSGVLGTPWNFGHCPRVTSPQLPNKLRSHISAQSAPNDKRFVALGPQQSQQVVGANGSDVSHAWWFPNQFFPTDLHRLFYWQSKLGLQDTPIPPHQAAQTPLPLKLSDTK